MGKYIHEIAFDRSSLLTQQKRIAPVGNILTSTLSVFGITPLSCVLSGEAILVDRV
jgi:hypothetical protein